MWEILILKLSLELEPNIWPKSDLFWPKSDQDLCIIELYIIESL